MVLHGDVWERQPFEFMCANARHRDVAHAGTYFGDFLPALAAATRGTIYAFEPNSEKLTCAEWTTARNALTNVRLRHVALGESNSESGMQIAQGGQAFGGFSHIAGGSSVPEGRSADFEDITTMRLDDVLPSDSDIGIPAGCRRFRGARAERRTEDDRALPTDTDTRICPAGIHRLPHISSRLSASGHSMREFNLSDLTRAQQLRPNYTLANWPTTLGRQTSHPGCRRW